MLYKNIKGLCLVLLISGMITTAPANAQYTLKWLSGGSLHNWYSEIGGEVEVGGFVGSQQDGMRWPGQYRYSDTQAAKGLWLGATNITDENGQNWSERIVHVGPRVSGADEFFPVSFELVSKYSTAAVLSDGDLSESLSPMVIDRIDPDLDADFMIINEVNTLLGVTMTRKIRQFTQEYHDNYHVIEYTFTNTGNVDADSDIELPNQTVEGLRFMLQWRWAVALESRYVIGNGTGWGMNTMLDSRGDGRDVGEAGEETFRAQYAWHGYFPAKVVDYDNIGGPILPEALPAINISNADTLGRLAASQFVGVVTLHADASAADNSDDPNQPSLVDWLGSDEGYQSQNSAFNPTSMSAEYALMTNGEHPGNRHALSVEPSGFDGFVEPTGNPAKGTPGGFSAANAYGPYTLAPGESVTIVIAEAVAGLSRAENIRIGGEYKDGLLSDRQKNEAVFQSRDSLFQTFNRAIASYNIGYAIPAAPAAPNSMEVTSGGDRISINWGYPADAPAADGFEVYRAQGRFDSTYSLVYEAGPGESTYDDTTPIRGLDYYYYVVAVKDGSSNNGAGNTPVGVSLRSSRHLTQTYSPARLKRPAGMTLEEIRVVPNPFNIASADEFRFGGPSDGTVHRLGFLNIPGQCRIDIYTELGELIDSIEHTDGSGDEFWDQTTSSRQTVASGLYIAIITNTENDEKAFRKFVIIR